MKSNNNILHNKIKVNEIFYSIQGESTYAGLPCIFIRLTYCNLRCNYCDTEYAFYEGKELTIEQIINEVAKYNCNLVEITGGEPLIQENVHDLIQELFNHNYEVLLETGGHLEIKEVDNRVRIIMDIKCPSSGESEKVLWSNLESINTNTEIKFVVRDKNDFDWAVSKIEHFKLNHNNILFSPVFGELQNKDLAQWILDSKIPARMQLQMHKYIWHPDKKGV